MTLAMKHAAPRRQSLLILVSALLLSLALAAGFLNWHYLRDRPVQEHLARGVASLEAGKPKEAEQEWRAALRLDPTRAATYDLLAGLYIDARHPDLAIPLLERLQQLAPRTNHVLCRLAQAYAETNQEQKALATGRQAVILEPGCPRAHALLGVVLGNEMETRESIAELSKAAALAPTDDKIAMSLAQALLDGNDLTGAERLARQVIARDPQYPTAYYTLGRSYSRRTPTPENLKEGIAAFEKATQLQPAWGDAFAELGRLRLLAGDNAGAITALEYLWKRGVRTQEVAFNLATAYRKSGDAARTARMTAEFKRLSDLSTKHEALRKRLALEPNNLDVGLQYAEVEIQAGNYQNAEELLSILLRARPRDPGTLKAAIHLCDIQGQKQQAQLFRQRLAALSQDERQAKR
jgi:predicted Zn-dependent protease